jgi:c-di-GMP-related signal transduction protein
MDVFVARQPIFDIQQNIFAYELLFRNGLKNVYENSDGDLATSSVLNSSFNAIGMESLTRGKLAFVNFTSKLLLDDLATAFPNNQVAVEILETVEPTPEIVACCRRLKSAGYKLILDDFVFHPKFAPLVAMADVIKIDFMSTPPQERAALTKQLNSHKVHFLAEKVETKEEFEEARESGYSYFQGYFFSKPEIISGREIPGYKLNYLRLIKEIHAVNVEFGKLEEIVKQDVSFSYKLLRFINSSYFGFAKKIESIRQALVLLGLREIKKWLSVIALSSIAQDKPEELIFASLVRARFCEMLAPMMESHNLAPEFFLMGMFSMIDAIVDRPKADLLKELPVSENIKTALLGGENSHYKALDLVQNYESGHWNKLVEITENLKIDEGKLPQIYLDAVDWANRIYQLPS